MPRTAPDPNPLDFDALLPAAAREILRDEDPQRFQTWLHEHLDDYVAPDARDLIGADLRRALATALGIAIWNATPLPGNGLRPRPLPRPGRNDRCPCGSGRKYKRCCGDAPTFPEMSPQLMWGYVFDALPAERQTRAIDDGHVPVGSLAAHAQAHLEEGEAARAVAMLEPLFAGGLGDHRAADHEFALDMLMNAYDALGRQADKLALVDRVIAEAPARSPMRASAWQRLATVRLDAGDTAGAWEAFEHAQREQPDAPALSQLEVVLLGASGRIDEVPERAKFWIRRLRRQGFGEDEALIEWLRDAADDPERTLASLSAAAADGAGDALLAWLGRVRGRAIPAYRLVDEDAGTDADEGAAPDLDAELAARLRAMGVPAEEIDATIARMKAQIAELGDGVPGDDEDVADGGDVFDEAPSPTTIASPPDLHAIEHRWPDVFPLDKPFSVNTVPFDEDDPWEDEDEWVGFLEEQPQAFDSLEVLDDLATAAMLHPAYGAPAFDQQVLVPILARAHAIVERALEGAPDPRLAWIHPENRPALRALVRLSGHELDVGDPERGLAIAERVLALNPHDNHGLRAIVVNEYLRVGRDEDALELTARYADDMIVDTRFGAVLALYRLGRIDEARAALDAAIERFPKVPRYLTRKQVRQPALEPDRFVVGGDDQAWYYREDMREVWAVTPGALEWLKRAARRR